MPSENRQFNEASKQIFLGVFIQCAILNRLRARRFTFRDQLVLAHGGLRGAIAFGLLSSVPDNVAAKDVFRTTTIFVICATVFLLGTTIRPLLSLLKIETKDETDETLADEIFSKFEAYIMSGVSWLSQHFPLSNNRLKEIFY